MTGHSPKVSVVIPCYNLGSYLDEAVESVLQQTFSDYEIIIVDDGSTDPATRTLLASYDRPKTKVLRTGNQGVSAARNTGIRNAAGSYILPLDADDRIAPGYLEKAVAILDARPDVGIVYSDEQMFGEKEDVWIMPQFNAAALLFDNLIFPSAFYRKCDWEKAGGYCSAMIFGWEDWEFWISMSRLNKVVIKIPEILYYYRIRSASRDHSLKFRHKIAMISVIVVRHWPLYLRNWKLLVKKATSLLRGKLKAKLSG